MPRRLPVSCESCTTNSIVPVFKAIHNEYDIEEALMTTAHAMTNTQAVVGGGRRDQDPDGGAAGVDARGRDPEGGAAGVDAQIIAGAGP